MSGTPGRSPSPYAAAIRTGGRQGFAGPGLAAAYTLGTWTEPHRPLMLAFAGSAIAVSGLMWWQADAVARSRARTPLRWAGALVNVVALTVVTFLGGGVGGPLGLLVPVSLIFFALITPPRGFLVIASLGLSAYWTVALVGDSVSPGYPLVYTLAFGGMSYLCLTHAGTLVSLRRRLATMSRADPLTHCLNRRGFTERLAEQVARADRSGQPFALILADLNGFKAINDTYGHQTGDDLLAWTGRTLSGLVGERDAVGRTGGDEFAVLLAGADPAHAAQMTERIRVALDGVTPASVGYACYPQDGSTPALLTHAADLQAYADKAARPSHPPTVEAVAQARAEIDPRRAVRVSRHERRRRSIADMGWIATSNYGVGLLYIALFTAGAPHRAPLAVLDAAGWLSGLLLVAGAGPLSRSRMALKVMVANACFLFPLGIVVAALDGGAGSALALGTLTPMPLIALGAPIRASVPFLAGASALYVGLGVVAGAPSGWYVAMNLVAMLGACVVCAAQGRAAAEQRALLTRLSGRDALTDAYNRRGFEERFAAEVGTGGPVALVLVDLDDFKQVNDSLGHAAGDELLSWVAATLHETVRGTDVVGRLGGDEFVVLLTMDSATAATAVAGRLKAAIASRTGASVGVGVLGRDGDHFDELYAHADAEMYAQKARVAVSGP